MRAMLIRRSAVAASAVSLALLAAACGGQESGGDAKGDGKAKGTAAAEPAAKALTAAELEKLALVQGDVKDHKIAKPAKDDLTPAGLTADKPACAPVAKALSALAVGKPVATVQRKVVAEPKKDASASPEEALLSGLGMTMTMASLSSYEGEGAEDVVGVLREAGSTCATGFTMSVAGEKQKITKLTPETVSGGQEALAWTVHVEQDGEKGAFKLAFVRQGTTLASFSAINLATPDYDLPKAVIDAQVAKLG
ncbi:hypothetical protein NLX86_17940 [Streptomyces sp. A3M-1-3]|uniref:hypothetical protein n=1 Tax=Streptomyces sp. A3M-1-3 TaxID=2962044 RepID=UPI0020B7746F|nr:hypothetical protein [Streptomyces sp. A3M-1-3]MCP3819908.1 hypothetical protein [Streptomyces sp. A3M-1-3]